MSRIKKTNLFLLAVDSSCGKCKSNGKRGNELPGIPGVSKENILSNYTLSMCTEIFVYSADPSMT